MVYRCTPTHKPSDIPKSPGTLPTRRWIENQLQDKKESAATCDNTEVPLHLVWTNALQERLGREFTTTQLVSLHVHYCINGCWFYGRDLWSNVPVNGLNADHVMK